jgi:hypothetical protein
VPFPLGKKSRFDFLKSILTFFLSWVGIGTYRLVAVTGRIQRRWDSLSPRASVNGVLSEVTGS